MRTRIAVLLVAVLLIQVVFGASTKKDPNPKKKDVKSKDDCDDANGKIGNLGPDVNGGGGDDCDDGSGQIGNLGPQKQDGDDGNGCPDTQTGSGPVQPNPNGQKGDIGNLGPQKQDGGSDGDDGCGTITGSGPQLGGDSGNGQKGDIGNLGPEKQDGDGGNGECPDAQTESGPVQPNPNGQKGDIGNLGPQKQDGGSDGGNGCPDTQTGSGPVNTNPDGQKGDHGDIGNLGPEKQGGSDGNEGCPHTQTGSGPVQPNPDNQKGNHGDIGNLGPQKQDGNGGNGGCPHTQTGSGPVQPNPDGKKGGHRGHGPQKGGSGSCGKGGKGRRGPGPAKQPDSGGSSPKCPNRNRNGTQNPAHDIWDGDVRLKCVDKDGLYMKRVVGKKGGPDLLVLVEDKTDPETVVTPVRIGSEIAFKFRTGSYLVREDPTKSKNATLVYCGDVDPSKEDLARWTPIQHGQGTVGVGDFSFKVKGGWYLTTCENCGPDHREHVSADATTDGKDTLWVVERVEAAPS